jgi:hypothetical protein
VIRGMGEDDVEVEIAPGTVVRFVKSAIARRVTQDEVEDEDIAEGGEEESA